MYFRKLHIHRKKSDPQKNNITINEKYPQKIHIANYVKKIENYESDQGSR